MKNTIIALAASAIALGSVNAQTIVNGDFEDLTGLTSVTLNPATVTNPHGVILTESFFNGVPTGWTFSGAEGFGNVYSYDIVNSAAPSALGTGHHYEVNISGLATLSQVISGLTIGTEYEISYGFGNRASTFDFDVAIDGVSNSHVGTGNVALTDTSLLFTATGTSATLEIIGNSGGSFSNALVDGFSIQQVVPEPSSAMLLGLSALGFLGRRKR